MNRVTGTTEAEKFSSTNRWIERRMAAIHYTLAISEEALEQLRALPRESRRRIGARLTQLQDNLSGDVKKLTAKELDASS